MTEQGEEEEEGVGVVDGLASGLLGPRANFSSRYRIERKGPHQQAL